MFHFRRIVFIVFAFLSLVINLAAQEHQEVDSKPQTGSPAASIDDIAWIAGLTQLEELVLEDSQVTDAGLVGGDHAVVHRISGAQQRVGAV